MTFGKIGARKMMYEWKNPYVTDGLVAMWDGQWNAEPGVHDPNATEWASLTGNGSLVLSGVTVAKKSMLFGFGTSAYSNTNLGLNTTNVVHGELCIDLPSPNVATQYAQFAGSRERIFANATERLGGISLGSGFVGHGTWPSRSHTLSVNWPNNELRIDDENIPALSESDSWSVRSKSTIIGDVVMQSGTARGFNGDVFCVRLYSRALTAAEIAANFSVDKARFNIA